MTAFSPKTLAIAAITMSLSSSALACLHLTGYVSVDDNGFLSGSITATDSDLQTCYGSIGTGDQNVGCINSYSLNYDYTDNNSGGPLPITYCNPHNCYGVDIPLSCSGNSCTFDYLTFCS